MKTSFKIGLILGIALLLLFPVYSRAQMILSNLQGSSSANPLGTTVANITATQGDTISFIVTCPSLSAPQFSMPLNPDQGYAQFSNSNARFTWNTGGTLLAPPGSYTAVFEATSGTQVEQLVVMIMINPATSQGTSCTSTVMAQASGTGGAIASATSLSGNCGNSVQFTGTITSGTATVSEGTYSCPNGLNWTWAVSTPATNGATKNVTITFSGSTTCQATVTAQASGTGGAITSSTSQTVSCGSTVSFSGTLTSGATATVSEGTFTPNGLYWNWTGISAPATNGGNKTVTITFTASSPGGPTGNWYSVLTASSSKICDTLILDQQNGVPMGFGRGFFKNFYPPNVYMPRNGTLYFIINPGAIPVVGPLYTGRKIIINVTDFDQTPSGCEAKVTTVDSGGNVLIPTDANFVSAGSGTFQMSTNRYNYQPNQIYIIEIKEYGVRDAYLSVNWN